MIWKWIRLLEEFLFIKLEFEIDNFKPAPAGFLLPIITNNGLQKADIRVDILLQKYTPS